MYSIATVIGFITTMTTRMIGATSSATRSE